MTEWLRFTGMLDITVTAALWFVGYIVLALFWRFVLRPAARRTRLELDRRLIEGLERPARLLYLVWGAYGLLVVTARIQLTRRASAVAWGVREAFFAVGLALACWIVLRAYRIVEDWLLQGPTEAASGKRGAAAIVRRFLNAAVLLTFVAVILAHYDVEITPLLGAAGIASLAVAFAAQETLANLISGVAILTDRPFRVGDRIELADGRIGDVMDIGLRTTRILSYDNTMVVVPNSEIAKQPLTNYSYPDAKVKMRHSIGVSYASDPDKVREVVLGILTDNPEVADDPAPQVYFRNFGDSALEFLVIFWISDYREWLKILDAVNSEIIRRFRKSGIEIPFPQRDVWFRNPVKMEEAGPDARSGQFQEE